MKTLFQLVPANSKHPLSIWQWVMREILIGGGRKRLQNQRVSILSNNCLGGMISHDLLQPQLSPTVNLFMYPKDYIKFLSHLEECLRSEMHEVDGDYAYPVGELNGCHSHFMHYHSFDEAARKWKERSKRINYENLLVIFVERDGCTYNDLLAFDKLPFKNKVAVVHKPYPEIKSALVFPGYEHSTEVGKITDWASCLSGRKIYDKVDWIGILNHMNL